MTQQTIPQLQETAIAQVVKDFPDLESLAQVKVTSIDNEEYLQQVILGLTFLHTRENVEQFLLRLSRDELKETRPHPVSTFDPVDPMYELIMVNAFAKGFSQSLQRRIQAGSVEIEQAIQWSVEHGVERGIQQSAQTLQATAIDVVKSKFPELLALAQRCITSINNLQILQQLVLDLSTLSSRDEVKQCLLSLFTDPLYKELFESGSEEVEQLLLALFGELPYVELPEDEVEKLAQRVQQETIDCVASLQKEARKNNLDVPKMIQRAVREGAKLGLRLGTENVEQAVYARVSLRYAGRESLTQVTIGVTDQTSCFREHIWDLCTAFEAERHRSESVRAKSASYKLRSKGHDRSQ
jgi:hypothetical protein